MLKGQFLPWEVGGWMGRGCQPSRGTRIRKAHEESSENVHSWSSQSTGSSIGKKKVFLKGQPVIVEAHYLQEPSFSVSSQKISLRFFKRRAPCSKTLHLLWWTQFWFSKTSDNHYIQICQLEKDKRKQQKKKSFFVFLSAVSTVRQTKSTVWIIHVLM